MLGPSAQEEMRRRISELTESRAGIVAAVDAERRRIERDLHDGVQQRLVALSMLVGRARRARDAASSVDLLRQAHDESQYALEELRAVAWQVYPAGLDALGLGEALDALADRLELPVIVDYQVTGPLPAAVETAAYFTVAEAVTNASKHARATRVGVRIRQQDDVLHVQVQDDGVGGADPRGGGLAGLATRVAALDGDFDVTSPTGGLTTVQARLPCG